MYIVHNIVHHQSIISIFKVLKFFEYQTTCSNVQTFKSSQTCWTATSHWGIPLMLWVFFYRTDVVLYNTVIAACAMAGFSKPPFGGWLHFECVNVIVFRKWYPHMSLLLHWKPSCCCWSLKPVLVEAGTWRRSAFFSLMRRVVDLWTSNWTLLLCLNASYGRCSYGMGFPFSLHAWIRRCQGYQPQLFTAAPFRMNQKLYWIWVPKISGGHIPQFLVIAQVKGVASGKCRCSWWRTWRERSSYQISVPTVQWLALAPKRSTGKRPCWLSSRWIFDILRSEVLGVLVLKCPAWLLVWDRYLLPFWLVPSWDKHTVLGGDIPFVNG